MCGVKLISSNCCPLLTTLHYQKRRHHLHYQKRLAQRCYVSAHDFHTAVHLQELLHNQVLLSATVATVTGQLSKPVLSGLLGKGFKLGLVFKSGGMPSTHSASVVAAATALGLDRGLSDSLFGLSVVVAGIVMYDAQGVRRAVSKQAEVINRIILSELASTSKIRDPSLKINNYQDSGLQREVSAVQPLDSPEVNVCNKGENAELKRSTLYVQTQVDLSNPNFQESRLSHRNSKESSMQDLRLSQPLIEYSPLIHKGKLNFSLVEQSSAWRHIPLKESVGHTKTEVLVGGIIGFIVTLMVHWIMWESHLLTVS
eukprot:TRINITY_DN2311_c0_g1_i1.p1 TRINITY_DN2311_c0_g1~~TRINITY_DN2311_c0_g1_i1.p1  ORF type:complete len:313 (+),score=49.28 TRINITY_DN2311_c0_g1_i1:85-1023(+)